jgi:hypothetical protein
MRAAETETLRQLLSLCRDPAGAPLPADDEAWERLLRLALEHDVAPLLWLRLQSLVLPSAARARLWAVYAANQHRNRLLQDEHARILAALAVRDVRAWPLKGPQLSQRLYGDAAARQAADLDVLIEPKSLDAADRALEELGYRRATPDRLERFRESQELLYVKPAGEGPAFHLDLHQRLLPYVSRDGLAERVFAAGMTPELLLVYLCANQVAHRFARLKHLLDIEQLLKQSGATLHWDVVTQAARELEFAPGIWHSLALAAQLSSRLVPVRVLEELRPRALERWLLRRTIGDAPATALSQMPRLEGPYGSFAVVASRRGVAGRIRQAAQLLFPPAVYLREQYALGPEQATLPRYFGRLLKKLPPAVRDLVKAVF